MPFRVSLCVLCVCSVRQSHREIEQCKFVFFLGIMPNINKITERQITVGGKKGYGNGHAKIFRTRLPLKNWNEY